MNEKITAAVVQACQQAYNVEPVVKLEIPDVQFGDVSTNVAMQLSRQLQLNPRDVAQTLAAALQQNPLFTAVGVAGLGFLNMTASDELLLTDALASPAQPLQDLKILVEYSDPNPFKPMHAGHLYTTLVGDVIARLVEHAGAHTIRLNYGGDVGLHVGKTMWAIEKFCSGFSVDSIKQIPKNELAAWLGARYADGNSAYEDDGLAKSEIIVMNKKVYELHTSGEKDSDLAQVYWYCREASYAFFTELYDQLQVHPFDRFIAESEVTTLGLKTVQEQLQQGVYQQSDGAVVFDGEAYGLHTRVFINSEGLPTYETKDVGLSLTKWQDYHFDESIIITANEQAQYMQVVLKSIAQFAPEPAERTRHITHGVLKLSGGMKMSSRKGNIVSGQEILDAARMAGEASNTATAEENVLAAVKYAFLKHRIGGDIEYDPQESIALEGNSGPYLQYAHARAKSILKKANRDIPKEFKDQVLEAGERSLVRTLAHYPDVITRATTELAPHLICTYLYELAQVFNRFYEQNKVIGDSREAERLYLVSLYADTLQKGLGLLGISAPDSM